MATPHACAAVPTARAAARCSLLLAAACCSRRPLLADEHGRYTDDYTAADEHFALRRTVSRLAEMQGMQYYLSSGASHTRHPAEGHPGRW